MVADVVRGEGEASGEPEPYHILAAETKLTVLQICANIVDYCRVAMTMGGGLTQITNRTIKCLHFAKKFFSKRKGIFFSVLSRYLLARLDITVDQSEKRESSPLPHLLLLLFLHLSGSVSRSPHPTTERGEKQLEISRCLRNNDRKYCACIFNQTITSLCPYFQIFACIFIDNVISQPMSLFSTINGAFSFPFQIVKIKHVRTP